MASAADIPALVQRLRSSSRVTQLQALKQLSELSCEEAVCSAIVEAGGVLPLVQLLTASSSKAAQESATMLLEAILFTEATIWETVVSAGGIPPLINVLQQGGQLAQQAAAGVLVCVAKQASEHGQPIAAPGAVDPLVQLLQRKYEMAQLNAVVALFWLAQDSEQCSAAVAAAGGIPAVVQLIPAMHEQALWLLVNLSRRSVERQNEIAAAGAGPLLQQELVSGSKAARRAATTLFFDLSCGKAGSQAVTAVAEAAGTLVRCLENANEPGCGDALTALANLALDDPKPVQDLLHAGLLPALGPCLRSPATDVATGAAWLVDVLAAAVPAEREAIGAAGVIPALVRLLSCKSLLPAEDAAWALRSLALDCPANRQSILDAGGFKALLSLLQGTSASGSSGEQLGQARGAAAVALTTLVQGSEQLKEEAKAAGAVAVIEQTLPIWQAGPRSYMAMEAAQAALNCLSNAHVANTSRQEADVSAEAAHPPAAARPPRVCAAPGCGATRGLHRCGGCGTVRYCSAACSKAHWRTHKAECRHLQAAAAEQQQPAV